ncbi:hypothetical protein SAMN05421504_112209 [Amycolatopsis xylanica]|uniref:Uncharacterized protein n=1 Tax=Amycolatopsis xylanica TaxID=589385 RepID=A0A1H3S3U1_9PSEU|nr:hypothetical protein SAMN05421504_112209 [Amycolatopsis xylanica]
MNPILPGIGVPLHVNVAMYRPGVVVTVVVPLIRLKFPPSVNSNGAANPGEVTGPDGPPGQPLIEQGFLPADEAEVRRGGYRGGA